MLQSILDSALFNYARARSLGFTAEYLLFDGISRLMPGDRVERLDPRSEEFKRIREALTDLLKNDSRNIREGLYPVSVLMPESPKRHLKRLPVLALDGLSLYLRRRSGKTQEFSQRARDLLEGLPRYYQRNFHFQTDGYLSRRSAEIYEHQVEMLFGGSADAMRRLLLQPLRARFGMGDGKGLNFLEVGAGTARTTRFVRLAYPKARIVTTDLSAPYLKVAQKKLADLDRVDFVQADAAELPFQDGHFDAVYSTFLFHELPEEARRDVVCEARRVLKPGGLLVWVDSLQQGDVPALDAALVRFPKQFHEPYYRNYIETKMEPMMEEEGFRGTLTRYGFFSKVCWAQKPSS
jgi:ubiquinone/menaquinone biosynthesis C-methylase UbiE